MDAIIPINRTYAPVQVFVDELARCGLGHAVTSPGSRNAPLLLSLAADPRIRTWSILDERSAAFFALGLAKGSGRPVALTCTSGTAAANFLPAVVEAHEARVPLIVLTADRPPELREVGAGQSIDQVKLYGDAVKWFVEVGNHEPSRETAIHHRALACRAHATAGGGRPGPVHLNFPLREPLAPVEEPLDPGEWRGRVDGRPWVSVHDPVAAPPAALVGELAAELGTTPRGAIVCGPGRGSVAAAAARLAATTGWPLLAEPTSGVRCGPHDRTHVVAHYDALLRAPAFAAGHGPDVVVRIGDTPTSKPLRAWLAAARQIVVDPDAAWHEPTRAADTVVAADPALTCLALAEAIDARGAPSRDEGWLRSWRAADAAVPAVLAATPGALEPQLWAAVIAALPDGATVWVSSSMPIRDVETFAPQRGERIRFLANRGANGIDGIVSSALGARAATGGPAWLLTGELALLHDLGGLLAARRHGLDLTIVCVNNGGGGIFDFLPVAGHADAAHYEEQIVTPAGADLAAVAAAFGLEHRIARTPEEAAREALRPGLVEVPADRAQNVSAHREVFARVAAQLDQAGGG